MSALFHYDGMLPAWDSEARDRPPARRQLEVFTASGAQGVVLRIGRLGEQHQGEGYAVVLGVAEAKAVLEGLEAAMRRLGHDAG